MAENNDPAKYDEALLNILVNEKSIIGFLSSIFNFLSRRTDFYYVPKGPYENIGFPPRVAEELVTKVLRKCDPKNRIADNNNTSVEDIDNDIMCSMVAQEVEVVTEDNTEDTSDDNSQVEYISETLKRHTISDSNNESKPKNDEEEVKVETESYSPPIIPIQKNSESYNGAERDKYTWSQNIMELDVIVKLPSDIKSAKDIKVVINTEDIFVHKMSNGEVIIQDSFPYKIKATESIWSISEGNLVIHLEKCQERWWKALLSQEEPIDLSKIDCSRNLAELPEEHIAKVRELQWNQEQKIKGLPTSDELRKIEILKKAWNVEGSPFKGTEFDPSVLHQ